MDAGITGTRRVLGMDDMRRRLLAWNTRSPQCLPWLLLSLFGVGVRWTVRVGRRGMLTQPRIVSEGNIEEDRKYGLKGAHLAQEMRAFGPKGYTMRALIARHLGTVACADVS